MANWIDYSKDGKGNYNVSAMISRLDEDEKIKINTNLNNVKVGTNTWFLTEDGLYEVLMQSRKPIAKMFRKEVKAILKQIRTTGGYIPVSAEMSEKEIMARALLISQNTLAQKDQIIAKKNKVIEMQQPKVEYHDKVLRAGNLLSISDIEKDIGMSIPALNKILCG